MRYIIVFKNPCIHCLILGLFFVNMCMYMYVYMLEQALKIFLNVFDFICINSLQHSLCNVFYILC